MATRPDIYDLQRLPPKTQMLWELAPAILGEAWQYRLAQIRQIGLKTVSRWSLGEREVPYDAIEMLQKMGDGLQASNLGVHLREIERMTTDGVVDPRVVSAHLTDLANRLKPTRKVPIDKKYKPRVKATQPSDASKPTE